MRGAAYQTVSVQLLKTVNCRTAATFKAKTRETIAETVFILSKLWVGGDKQQAKTVLPFVPRWTGLFYSTLR